VCEDVDLNAFQSMFISPKRQCELLPNKTIFNNFAETKQPIGLVINALFPDFVS